MGDRLEVAEAADIDVGEEAGGEILLRLDQRDVDRAGGVLVDVARDRAAARAAADHDELRLAPGRARRGANSGTLDAAPEAPASAVKLRRVSLVMDVVPSWFWCRCKIGGERLDLVVLEAAGDVLHHRVGQFLVAVGFDRARTKSCSAIRRCWDRGGCGRAAMAGHAFGGEIAAEFEIGARQHPHACRWTVRASPPRPTMAQHKPRRAAVKRTIARARSKPLHASARRRHPRCIRMSHRPRRPHHFTAGSVGAASPSGCPFNVCMKATRSSRSCSVSGTGMNSGERLGRSIGSFS